MKEAKLTALLKLLEDPDPFIKNAVIEQFISEGLAVIPLLENKWEAIANPALQGEIETLIQKLQFSNTTHSLEKWKSEESDNLLKGACLIAQYQYPEITYDDLDKYIEKIKRDTWIELRDNFTPLEQINVLNHIFFQVHKFSRNTVNFFAPQNSYINLVLESKKGNPISLAILYKSIANRLDIPLFGVNLPKNFILAYLDKSSKNIDNEEIEHADILFYVNPFNRGAVLSQKDILFFLKQQQIEKKDEYFFPCNNQTTIIRLIDSLIFAYNKLGYPEKIKELKALRKILSDNEMPDSF